MLRNKIKIAVIALLAGVTFAFTTKSNAKVMHGRQVTVWYYNGAGSTEADLQNGDNWDTSNSGSCQTTGTRPCSISSSATTQDDLSTQLSGETKAQILAMSSQRKP